MIWNKWPFFIVLFVAFICSTVYINHFVMYNNDSFEENLKKSHSDVVEHFKELPFIMSTLKNQKLNA